MTTINYQPVAPIGTRTTFGHQNMGDKPHVWGEFEVNEYPDSWEGLRLQVLRRELGLYLGDAARILGIGVAQMSSLERGAATCDWDVAMRLLREAPVDACKRPTRPDWTPVRPMPAVKS